MIRGSSKTSGSSDAYGKHRSAWLAALLFYGLAASGDFTYHLTEALRSDDQAIEVSDVAVAFSAAVFWPVDLVAMWLLARR
jgi:hypothetical protein